MADNARRVAFSTASQIGARVATSLLGAVSLSVSTRYLGVDRYGQLATIFIFLGIFATFTDFGTTTIAIRELAQHKHPDGFVLGNILAVRGVAGVVAAVVAVGCVPLVYHRAGDAHIRLGTALMAASLVFVAVQSSLSSILSAQIRNHLVAVGDVASKAVTLVIIVLSAHLDAGFYGFVLAYLAGAAFDCLSDCFFSLRACAPSFDIDVGYIKHILRLAAPYTAAVVLNSIYANVDGFMLSLIRGSGEVGLYGVAYRIVQLTMSFPILFMTAIFPLMAAAGSDRARLRRLVDRSIALLNVAGAGIVVGVIAVSTEAIQALAGRPYVGAALPMAILMTGNYFVYLNSAYVNALLAADRQGAISKITASTLTLNIAVNAVTIPLAGAAGAAASVAIAEAVQLLVLRHYYRSYVGTPHRFRIQLPPLLCAALTAAVMLATEHALEVVGVANLGVLVVTGCVGAAVYLGSVTASSQLDVRQLRVLLQRAS